MELRRDVFQALADPTRRAILELLASQTRTAGELAKNFDSARPTISNHIRILQECNLVESRQEGRMIYYTIKIEKLEAADEWLELVWNTWQAR